MAAEGTHASFRFEDFMKLFTIGIRRVDFRGEVDDTASVSFVGAAIKCAGQEIKQDHFNVEIKGGTLIPCARQDPGQETVIVVELKKSPPAQMFIGPTPTVYDSEPADPPPPLCIASGYAVGGGGYRETKPECISPKGQDQLFDLDSIRLQRQGPSGPATNAGGTIVESHPKKICYKAWASAYDGQSSTIGGCVVLRVNVKTPRKQ
jgi:hypothetical protein